MGLEKEFSDRVANSIVLQLKKSEVWMTKWYLIILDYLYA